MNTTKEDELSTLKKTSRITKFLELELKLKSTMDELLTCKDEYTKLIRLYDE